MTAPGEAAHVAGTEQYTTQMMVDEIYRLSHDHAPQLEENGVVRTPLVPLEDHPLLEAGYGLQVKDEGLQHVRAYKVRGATLGLHAALAQAKAAPKNTGDPAVHQITHVVTASNGNHAQGVVYAAKRAGLSAIIETSSSVSPDRIAELKALGMVAVHPVHTVFDNALKAAARAGELSGHAFIPPFDKVEIMAGGGSVAQEILDDLIDQQHRGEIDLHADEITIVLPGGGGGLAAGCAAVFNYAKRQLGLMGNNVKVIVAQMEKSDAIARLRHNREPLTEQTLETFANSTAVLEPGQKTMAIVLDPEYVQDVISLPKELVAKTMRYLTGLHGDYVEPAGALSMAGAMQLAEQQGSAPKDGRRHVFVTVTSGRNISEQDYRDFHPETTPPKVVLEAAKQTLNPELKPSEVARRTVQNIGRTGLKSKPKAPKKIQAVTPTKTPTPVKLSEAPSGNEEKEEEYKPGKYTSSRVWSSPVRGYGRR